MTAPPPILRTLPTSAEVQAGTSFLAEASRLLADSLDYETTLATVASLSLPYLGAWCIVDLLIDGEMRRAAVIHSDPEMQLLARGLELGWPPQRDDPFGVPQAIRTRQTEVISDISDEMLVEVAHGDEVLETLRALGMGSLLVVPLQARGDVLGAITYVSPDGGRSHGSADVALAEDLAARCAIALDNARLHAEAVEARRAADDATQAKGQFLAVMSHELRTPLTGVISFADLLETEVLGPMEEKQQEACARIKANAWHLISIIDEILLLSRANANRLEAYPEETDVVEVVREVIRSFESTIDDGRISLRVEDGGTRTCIWTDPGKLRQILFNLVANATKYASDGKVTVTVEFGRPTVGHIQIHVHDTGKGIPLEDQERIFEPFTQADSSHTRTVGGTGLGLSISRQLAQLLGGDVTIVSAPGEGSTFTLQLPVRHTPEA